VTQTGSLPPAVIVPDGLTALGLTRSLAREGVPCIVGSANALGPARYSRHARPVPCPAPSAGRAFLDGLVALGRTHTDPPVLFVTDESSLLMVERGRAELQQWFRLTLPASATLAQWVSKPQLYQTSRMAGVATPQTWVLDGDALPGDATYPTVLKPTQRVTWAGEYALRSFRHEFGCKAMLARDAADARRLVGLARSRGFAMLMQQPIPGEVTDLLTAGVFAGRSGMRALFTARKLAQVPHDFGDGSVVEGLPLPDLAAPAWRVAEQAGLIGIADLEFKRDARDGQLKLLDANPRPWLWIELATRCGVNLPYLLYREAIGDPCATAPVQTAARVTWCSPRGVVRTLLAARGANRRAAVRAAWTTWRTGDRGDSFTRDGVLWRMIGRPAFWRDLASASRHRLREP
jgi:predicted ATP-grasp superfamily ATP-dependent carboligase